MRLTDNVEMLELKSKSGPIHPTLVWDDNNLVLIDTGYPLEVDLLEAEMKKAGFALEDVNMIILTHHDIDHVGCVNEVVARSGARVFAHEKEIPYINGERIPVKIEEMGQRLSEMPEEDQVWYQTLKKAFENRRADVDEALVDKEVLAVAGGLEIVYTPGHTPGHICVYVRDSKVLVAGDQLNIREGKLSGADPKYSQNMDLGKASAEKLKGYDVDWVVVYHGGALRVDGTIEYEDI